MSALETCSFVPFGASQMLAQILVPVGVSALRATCGGPGGRGARGRAYRRGCLNNLVPLTSGLLQELGPVV